MNFAKVIAIFILSFGTGLLAVNITETSGWDNVATGTFYLNNLASNENVEPHKPKYGTSWYLHKPKGSLYASNKPNSSGWADSLGVPPFKVNINEKGFRDNSFTEEKPEDTIRIMIFGDSITFGRGVNQSDTYPKVVEKKLNNYFKQDIQVINAGVSGYGMKDQYLLLKNKGVKYEPDIVVITINNNDWHSRKEHDLIAEQTTQKIMEENQSQDLSAIEYKQKIREETGKLKKQKLHQTKVGNSSFQYLNDIRNITDIHNISLIYYAILYPDFSPRVKKLVRNQIRKQNVSYYNIPNKFKNEEVRISRWDPHPDARGHEIAGEKLQSILKKRIE